MNVGSLFSGIGGFDLGLERAGMRVAWQCESDPFCRAVLASHWPDVPCYPDVRELDGGAVEPVHVLCGGFPCQDLSYAGKDAGIDGERSGLWAEYARLVGELRPRYVVVENVAALLNRGLSRVLGDLAALGYDAEWDCLPASAFGAPHRRDRLWVVAYPDGSGGEARAGDGLGTRTEAVAGQPARQGGAGDVADPERRGRPGWPQDTGRGSADWEAVKRGEGADQPARRRAEAGALADAEGEPVRAGLRESEPRGVGRGRPGDGGCADVQDADERAVLAWRVGGRAAQTGGPEWWAAEPPVGRVAHGVPDRLDQLAALGNALVPQIAEWLGRRILEAEEMRTAA